MSDEEWFESILGTLEGRREPGPLLPEFPPEDIQKMTNSRTGRDTMLGAFAFYRRARHLWNEHRRTDNTKILDFGCGWGRIARVFLRDIEPQDLYGIDIMPKLIDAASATMPSAHWSAIEPGGTLPHDDETFGLVFANSVFSHLTEKQHHQAMSEIARVTAPGGVIIATCFTPTEIDILSRSDNRGFYEKVLGDLPAVRDQVAAGEFVWASTGRKGRMADYGLAVIPEPWFAAAWPDSVEFLEVGHYPDYTQALAVGRKRS